MRMRIWLQSSRLKTVSKRRGWGRGAAAALLLGAVTAGPAAGEPEPGEARPVVAAGFMLPQVKKAIPGSRETVMAAAWKTAGETRLMPQNRWEALGLDWSKLLERAGAAWAECGKLEPELARDRRGVLDCAILRSEEPGADLTGAIFAPGFLSHFTPLFGSKLLVAIPDRRTLFIFPRLASRYNDYAERVLAIYQAAEHPVSREIYEVSAGGVRAIGAYEAP